VNEAVDPDALWLKGKVFINRALAAKDNGAFDEAGVWAASALELLGKAALSTISPLLIADPSDDGKSLLIAAGVSKDAQGFKTIQAKTVFSRCARAFPSFNEREAGLIAGNRNEELHSGTTPFQELHEDSWWERYWAQAAVLVAAQGKAVEALVGSQRAQEVEGYLARNVENIQRRVAASIERGQQHFEQLLSAAGGGTLRPTVPAASGEYEFEHEAECPACKSPGLLLGDYVGSSDIDYDSEDGYPTERLVVYAEEFACPYCGLHLQGSGALVAAGVPEQFDIDREAEHEWDDYGND
jgi:hypothetical protein